MTRSNPKGEVYFTALSTDGRHLVTIVHDGTLRLWDIEAGKELRSWKVPTRETTTTWNYPDGHKQVFKVPYPAIGEPAFSRDGTTLLAAHGSTILRWETATGRELPALEIAGLSAPYGSGCLPSPDGRTLVVWSVGGPSSSVCLVDAANGKVRQRLEGIRGANQLSFSVDGRTIAFAGIGEVSLWEVSSGRPRGRLMGPRWAFSLAFSPDSRFLAVGSDAGSPINLWDLATGEVAGSLANDLGRVHSLAFSPDGARLVVAGDSPTVLVCDVAALRGNKEIKEIVKLIDSSAEELEGLWAELSGADAALAYRAIRRLGLSGSRGAVFLRTRLKGDKPPDERRIARLIAELDDDAFATREKASAELRKLGVRAEAALRRTLEGEVSAEVRSRVKGLLERLGPPQRTLPSPELVRLRIVEALEANGSKGACQALAELSEGSTDALLAREAKASLARLRSGRVQP